MATAALMLAGLASCTYKEDSRLEKMDAAISFNAPVTSKPWTKALTDKEIGPEYDKNESFTVWAVIDNGGTRSYYMGSANSGVKCAYSAAEPDGWYPENTWYWPVRGSLDFRAMSPADAAGTPTFGLDGKFSLAGFQVPAAGSQYDLMVSDLSTGWVGSGFSSFDNDNNTIYKYNGVDLLFRHALCQVEFRGRLASAETSSVIRVKDVALHGMDDIGTLSVDETNTAEWTGFGSSAGASKVDYQVFTGDQQLEYKSDGSSTILKEHTLMLLPQVLSRGEGTVDKVRVRIRYHKDGEGDKEEIKNLGGLLGTEGGVGVSIAVNRWLPGRKYVYTFVIGEDQMFFDPTVIDFEDWGGDIEIK